jgi:hypothetical protein
LIAEAERQGELPVAVQGYVPAEYARRRANGYLTDHLSLHYSATNGAFVGLAVRCCSLRSGFGCRASAVRG